MLFRVDIQGGDEGYVVIDSIFDNSSSGGIRIAEDISLEEVKVLAREMTLKYAFIGLHRGGAKAGLRIPRGCSPDKKRDLLFEFGWRIGPIIRLSLFCPWTDMNCSKEDLKILNKGAGVSTQPISDSSRFTGMSVFEALEACRESIGNRTMPLRIGIEGFGAVATWLARSLAPERYKITAISTIEGTVTNDEGFKTPEILEKRQQYSDTFIEHLSGTLSTIDKLFEADIDILVPSARIWSLSEKTASMVKARFIVPAANAPYGINAIPILEEKGCVCLPGFAVNSGGVFGTSLNDNGVPMHCIESLASKQFKAVIQALIKVKLENQVSPCLVAEMVAMERLKQRFDPASNRSAYLWKTRKLLRRKLLPTKLFWRNYMKLFIENLLKLENLVIEHGRSLSRQRQEF